MIMSMRSSLAQLDFYYMRKDNEFTAEVRFELGKDYWGQGLMSEAMEEVIFFGFARMGLDVIDATGDPKNERSINLMRKLGFKEQTDLKDNLLYFYLKKKKGERE